MKVLKLSAQGLPQSWISLEEAVLLADGVVVMGRRPGRIVCVRDVGLARPHAPGIEDSTVFAEHVRALRTALTEGGIEVKESELTMLPTSTVEIDEASKAKSVLRVIDALEEHDDVQNVYANFDIPDAVLEEVEA